jgi:hypothetical protein
MRVIATPPPNPAKPTAALRPEDQLAACQREFAAAAEKEAARSEDPLTNQLFEQLQVRRAETLAQLQNRTPEVRL